MIPPWSLSAAFRLVLILLAASLSGAIASNPWTHDQEVIAGGQQRMKACVFGSPKTYDQWTIHYHEVKPSSQFPGQLILDPAWVARHQTVGDTDVRAASFMILKEMPSSNIPSVSPWVPRGSHGPRIGASIAATRGKTVFLLPDTRLKTQRLIQVGFPATSLTPSSNPRILYHDHAMVLIKLHMPITGSVIRKRVSEEKA